MKKKLFVLLAVIMVLSMISIPAMATPPENAEGEWIYLPTGQELLKVAGGNTFLSITEDSRWTGTFDGESKDHGTVVIYRSGRLFFKGEVEFTSVTVNGQTGTLELQVNGSKQDSGSDWVGRWVVSGGELYEAGLRGQGSWDGPGWQGDPEVEGEIHYSGNIHFE